MKILAIETATEACSAALSIDGEVIERCQFAPRQHSELILNMLHEVLSEAGMTISQMDAIAFGRGPGSFIGLRIAAGVTQGIAFAADLPVVPVSSLAALAQATEHDKVLAAIDARMQEVYWGWYERDEEIDCLKLVQKEVVSPTRKVRMPTHFKANQLWYGVGTGWNEQGPNLAVHLPTVTGFAADVYPRAAQVAYLGSLDFENGLAVPAEQAQPIYLRDNVAKKSH